MVYTNKKQKTSRSSRVSRSMRNSKPKSKTMKNKQLSGGYTKDKDTHKQHMDKPKSGGGSCGNEGVGTEKPKSETFKTYLNSLDKKLGMPLSGGSSCGNKILQNAGGYTTDPSEYIAGMPVYKGYSDWAAPAIINGSIVSSKGNAPVCGSGAMRGGRKQKQSQNRKHKTSSKTRSKSSSKTRKYNGRGGYSNRSKPVDYDSAFNGAKSVFSNPDNMSNKKFDELQPNYSVNAI